MRIAFFQDLNPMDHQGGAEQNDREMIRKGFERHHNIQIITPQNYNLIIIEDACQSFGSEYKNKKAGTFGLCGCFSCHPLKTLSCPGDGGFITTNDDETAEKLKILRDHGQKTNETGKEITSYG